MAVAVPIPTPPKLGDCLSHILPHLRSRLRSMRLPPSDVDDIVQDTCVAFLARGSTVDSTSFAGWCCVTARRKALNHIRATRCRTRNRTAFVSATASTAWTQPQPMEDAIHREDIERMRRARDELPADLRHLLDLKFAHNLSLSHISRRTGIPKSTVGDKLQHALVLLTRLFNDRSNVL